MQSAARRRISTILVQEKAHARRLLSVPKSLLSCVDKACSYVVDTGIDTTHPDFQGREYRPSDTRLTH
jgi:hypothetical protein